MYSLHLYIRTNTCTHTQTRAHTHTHTNTRTHTHTQTRAHTQITISGFVSEEMAQDIEQFFKKNPVPVADRTIKQCCEGIRLNAQWLRRDQQAIQQWLQQL